MKIRFAKLSVAFFSVSFFLLSCSAKNQYPHLYDKTGFDQGGRPQENNPNTPTRIAPDYYYRQSPQAHIPQAMPPQYQQPYQQPPYPQVPYQHPYSGSPYTTPGSRFYSNPYAIPPSPYYPQYDADQYYVPPAYQYGIEPQPNDATKNSRAY
ncbi:MAG: hypothetical protein A2887_06080 [Alphaproteobacteria bacterium RIFCSPLOWO2_01_FULL_40_26]|nr:MAG: hypothetical protein A3D15_04390 [Alphaproteobacteria bacterium RIFCSPHIGHO2_02_FULL_40_34]OFW85414.1 MAG: hypothetical protein A2794_05290 [Alphaproteobacteria bacterium RIFCSPHIGHO2_01_FULL_40_8]OFW94122.1 MAG: hypothetical protein A2887_06080 [Alphaproteobacteria bacterium RIFCSPLOWO2_01_FULL_40_26]OFX09707.1 MAG: hypothetical protein A3H30_06705 [Alphaproteobacteria bacterium RIFCSPLOWO2_02_FULL_40_19]OFX11387.1 MAG: hypothetical protein A3G22_06280 [Alphaproteobacteria bacterium RI